MQKIAENTRTIGVVIPEKTFLDLKEKVVERKIGELIRFLIDKYLKGEIK